MKLSIAILAAAAIAATPAGASAGQPECFHHRGETVAHSAAIRVIYTDGGYYACKRGSGRYLRLGFEDAGHDEEDTVEGFAIAGNLLAYRRVDRDVGGAPYGALPDCRGAYSIRVVDMRTRRLHGRYDVPCDDDVERVVLRRDGAAAWISRNFYGGPAWSLRVEGELADSGDAQLAKLKLTHSGISWLHGAEPRSAPLP